MHKLLLFLFIGILSSALYMLFTTQTTVSDFPRKEGPIVAFGDSLMQGVGATDGNTFVDILSQRIGEDIINLGVSGNTTVDALMRIRELEEYNPRLVIILLGGNDALRNISPDDTFQNLSLLIETLHKKNAAVLLLGITGGISYGQTYEREFEALAERYKVAFVPNVLHGLIGRPEFMSDAIHPNDAGYTRIADKIEPELQYLLDHSKQ
jgi:acyl-CoA thioesterase I